MFKNSFGRMMKERQNEIYIKELQNELRDLRKRITKLEGDSNLVVGEFEAFATWIPIPFYGSFPLDGRKNISIRDVLELVMDHLNVKLEVTPAEKEKAHLVSTKIIPDKKRKK